MGEKNEKVGKGVAGPLSVEKGIVGLLIFEPDTVYELVPRLTADHFSDAVLRKVFIAIKDLYENEGYDPGLLRERLLEDGVFTQEGWEEFLADVARYTPVPSADVIELYTKTLHRYFVRRELKVLGERLAHDVESDPEELLELVLQKAYDLAEERKNDNTLNASAFGQRMRAFLEKVTGTTTELGIPTFVSLDRIVGGLHPGQLIIVAARPGMGKTSFALAMMLKQIKKGYTPAFFSLEMDAESVGQRILSMLSAVPLVYIRTGRLSSAEQAALEEIISWLQTKTFFVDDTPSLSISDLRVRLKKLVKERGVDVAFVDYLQLIRSSVKRGSRQEEVAEISRQLKALAKEVNIPIIALAQLSRQVEHRNDKRPQLADLRESGQIEQDADLVLFLYRPEYYMIIKKKEVPEELKGKAEVIVAKNRQGPTGTAFLYFDASTTAFEDPEDDTPLNRKLHEKAVNAFGKTETADEGEDLPDLPEPESLEDLGISFEENEKKEQAEEEDMELDF